MQTGALVDGEWTDGSAYSHDDQATFWAPGQPDFSKWVVITELLQVLIESACIKNVVIELPSTMQMKGA